MLVVEALQGFTDKGSELKERLESEEGGFDDVQSGGGGLGHPDGDVDPAAIGQFEGVEGWGSWLEDQGP